MVTRIARPMSPPDERCGSSEVCTDWKSCSGARAISSALKTTPAIALPDAAATVRTAALSSVCSASWTPATERAKPLPSRSPTDPWCSVRCR